MSRTKEMREVALVTSHVVVKNGLEAQPVWSTLSFAMIRILAAKALYFDQIDSWQLVVNQKCFQRIAFFPYVAHIELICIMKHSAKESNM